MFLLLFYCCFIVVLLFYFYCFSEYGLLMFSGCKGTK